MMNSDSGLLSDCGLVDDESYLDGCSICLEPFTSVDPPSVTKCKHEYHLHCILDWSQRRIECPVCLRPLVLNDPTSQELLASVGSEKKLRSQPLMRRHIARNLTTRTREMIPASQIIPSVPTSNVNAASSHNLDSCSWDAAAAADSSQSANQNSGKSEFAAFSESLKSKISTASIRYKDSISKSSHSLKEKLIARNDSVKELSRGVQREMSAGIAGIARMIAQKRAALSVSSSR